MITAYVTSKGSTTSGAARRCYFLLTLLLGISMLLTATIRHLRLSTPLLILLLSGFFSITIAAAIALRWIA
jgi:hypothetical protein